MTRAGFDKASGSCAGRAQPGARALMDWALSTYSTARNLGIYNCRNARGGTSKSVHADGRADDIAFPMPARREANPLGHDLAARLVAHADTLGVQLVIFDQAIWTSRSRRWQPHCRHPGATGPHTGCSGPHFDHVHVEITWAAARGPLQLTVEEIARILGPPIAPPQEDDDMPWTDEDREDQKAIRAALESINHQIAGEGSRLPRIVRAVEAIARKLGA